MFNCTAFIDVNRRFGDKKALIDPKTGVSYSFAELHDVVCRAAGGLRALGIKKGDRVAIYLESSPEYLLSYLAIWRIGAIAVPMNIVLQDDEVLYMLMNAGARAIITNEAGSAVLRRIRDQIPGRFILIATGAGDADTTTWEELLDAQPLERAAYTSADDLCQLQYTSGTTGAPKGAMLSHGNWMTALDAEREVLGLTENDIYLGIYPMAHVGVSWGIAALKTGATWIIMDRFELDPYIAIIADYRVSVIASMPPVIHSLNQLPAGTEAAFVSGRVMISGGGPLHPSIWKDFYQRFGIAIVNAYGLSETIVVGTGTAIRPEDYATAEEFRSVGKPVGYTEVRIVDVNDPTVELPSPEIGEIALRGPAVAKGYWQMPDATEAVFLAEGWFLTGDIGYIDGDGMLAITDRKKDMIVMSGWKIYPTEVEKVLIQHPKIEDVAIFGIPDIRRGEIPVAAIVPAAGARITLDELVEYSRERLAGYKVPRKLIVLEELPRVHGWKLLRRELRDRFGSVKPDVSASSS
jgi:long-chain acyl-CoA synthetase